MFDRQLRALVDAPLDRVARRLAGLGVSANGLTLAGFGLGVGAAVAIAFGHMGLALVLFACNRLADGLDGPVARQSNATALGGFLDITCDFAIYGAVPLAFAWANPAQNALAATILLFSFYLNGAAFLAFSALAAKLGLETTAQGRKSIYYVAGLAEGAETIVVFFLMMVAPSAFPALALAFAALTMLSALFRIILGWTTFRMHA
jgi:phosphatidylglycerophosphate synthase